MKFKASVSDSRRKARKAHFKSGSTARRLILSAPLSKELREKHGVRSLPIRREDEVKIVRGSADVKLKEGKVTNVSRRKFLIHVERVTVDKKNNQSVHVPIHATNVVITKLSKLDEKRKATIQRKQQGREARAAKAGSGASGSMAQVD
jgi:large subunit ribosomal protein L26e